MSEYRCSQCGTTYIHPEYMALDKVSRVTDDPEDKYGVETVCECGARFHSDKWQLDERVEAPSGEEIRVSTVALLIPHGMNHDQWFETCLFHDTGSQVVDRYRTQNDAEDGHERWKETIRSGNYAEELTGRRLVFDA